MSESSREVSVFGPITPREAFAEAAAVISSGLSRVSPRDRQRAAMALEMLARQRAGMTPQAPPKAQEAEEITRAREHLLDFVRLFWPVVEPLVPFSCNWHIEELCLILERVTAGELDRVLINVPPGSSKSLIVSVFWPAWEWTKFPDRRYLCASYAAELSTRDNLRVRTIVSSDLYQRNFELRLRPDQNQKKRFYTTSGGWRVATSVGGAATGEHPDRVIVDDPTTVEQAMSEADRNAANAWFDGTITTRGVTRKVAIVVIMQRLHQKDLTGHLLERGGWTHVCFPMRFRLPGDPRDRRTTPGELLWPELFSEATVARMEAEMGAYNAAGQLAQLPAPEGGGLFERAWFEIVDELPKGPVVRSVRAWDTAATAGSGDYTAGVKITQIGSTFYVEDVVRGQWAPAKVDETMLHTARMDGRSVTVAEEKEGGSAGKAVTDQRGRMLVGFDYVPIQVTGSKIIRASPFRSQAQQGNVKLLRGPWNAAYLNELAIFPNGDNDDQVDGSTAAFNEMTKTRVAKQVEVSWG